MARSRTHLGPWIGDGGFMVTWLLVALLSAMPQGNEHCGPPHRCVAVPNVLLMEFPMAESTIRKAGLKIDKIVRIPHEKPSGIVFGQGPGPGERVMVGYQMVLYVSKGPQ